MTEKTGIITTASGRTLNEVKAEIRVRMRSMVNNALEIGVDLIEAKEACRHGEWLPFLKEIGFSASTAANYMRIAKEVSADSKMAGLPYTKILALLAAPPEEREELAQAAEDMSAAEIRRLTEERNKAAEAANMETARADQAEADAKMFNQEAANLRNQVSVLRNELNKQTQYNEDLRGKLIYAENNRVEVEKRVEVVPEDYERLKKEQKELLDAAAKAEERANEAEAELERIQMDGDGGKQPEKPVGILLNEAVNTFLCSCDMMTFDPVGLQRDAFAVRHGLENLQEWINRMQAALEMPVITEANVI